MFRICATSIERDLPHSHRLRVLGPPPELKSRGWLDRTIRYTSLWTLVNKIPLLGTHVTQPLSYHLTSLAGFGDVYATEPQIVEKNLRAKGIDITTAALEAYQRERRTERVVG